MVVDHDPEIRYLIPLAILADVVVYIYYTIYSKMYSIESYAHIVLFHLLD